MGAGGTGLLWFEVSLATIIPRHREKCREPDGRDAVLDWLTDFYQAIAFVPSRAHVTQGYVDFRLRDL